MFSKITIKIIRNSYSYFELGLSFMYNAGKGEPIKYTYSVFDSLLLDINKMDKTNTESPLYKLCLEDNEGNHLHTIPAYDLMKDQNISQATKDKLKIILTKFVNNIRDAEKSGMTYHDFVRDQLKKELRSRSNRKTKM